MNTKMKIPKLCEGCPHEQFFTTGEACWVYWKGKKKCPTKGELIRLRNEQELETFKYESSQDD